MTGIGPQQPNLPSTPPVIGPEPLAHTDTSAIDNVFGEAGFDFGQLNSALVGATIASNNLDVVDQVCLGPAMIEHIRQTSRDLYASQGMQPKPARELAAYAEVLNRLPPPTNLARIYASDPTKHWDMQKPVLVLFADEHYQPQVSLDYARYLHQLIKTFDIDILPVEESFADIMPVSRLLPASAANFDAVAQHYGPVVAAEYAGHLESKPLERRATENIELGLDTFFDDLFLVYTQYGFALAKKDQAAIKTYGSQMRGLVTDFMASHCLRRAEPERSALAKIFNAHMEKLKQQFGIEGVTLFSNHVGIQGGPQLNYYGIDLANSSLFRGIVDRDDGANKKMEVIYKYFKNKKKRKAYDRDRFRINMINQQSRRLLPMVIGSHHVDFLTRELEKKKIPVIVFASNNINPQIRANYLEALDKGRKLKSIWGDSVEAGKFEDYHRQQEQAKLDELRSYGFFPKS